jgi:hypothetical protein
LAFWEFARARHEGMGLAWRKTDHVYPTPLVAAAPRYQSSASGDQARPRATRAQPPFSIDSQCRIWE